MKQRLAAVAGAFVLSVPFLASANGVRPPRTQATYDVTCETSAGSHVVRNARVTGLELGLNLSEFRMRGGDAGDIPLPIGDVVSIALGRVEGAFSDATLTRKGRTEPEHVKLRVSSDLGPVRLLAFASAETVDLAACKTVIIAQRERDDEGSYHPVKKK